MELMFFAPIWGSEDMPFEAFLHKVKENNFDGVEMSFPQEFYSEKQRDKCVSLLQEYDLHLIAQHWETVTPNFQQYKCEFLQRLDWLAATEALLINSQTGRDFFTPEQTLSFLDIASEKEVEHDIIILHETHRGRFNYSLPLMQQFLNARPNIKLTADYSHFCCVAGNLLEDQQTSLAKLKPHVHHIHSRVGFSEGPQVADPRAPESATALATHLAWWVDILAYHKQQGRASFTITTEFGPPPYMPVEPHTQKPMGDQWANNLFIRQRIKQAYQALD